MLYDEAPCGYLYTRPDGTLLRINATFLEWTGYDRGELLGRRFQDLLNVGGRIFHARLRASCSSRSQTVFDPSH